MDKFIPVNEPSIGYREKELINECIDSGWISSEGPFVEKFESELSKKINAEVSLNIIEIRKPELDAKLVADGIAQQLERRVAAADGMEQTWPNSERGAEDTGFELELQAVMAGLVAAKPAHSAPPIGSTRAGVRASKLECKNSGAQSCPCEHRRALV